MNNKPNTQPTMTIEHPTPIRIPDNLHLQAPRTVLPTRSMVIKLGVDVHLKLLMVVVQEGHLPPKAPRKMTPGQLLVQVTRWVAQGYQVHAVQESCGFGFVLHRRLVEAGAHSLVITPIRLEERGRPRKTDKLDAKALCIRLSRYLDGQTDELQPIRIPSEEEQCRREVSRRREFYQQQLRRLDNHAHALVAEYAHQPLARGWWGPRKWKEVPTLFTPWLVERLAELRELILRFHVHVKAVTQQLQQRVTGQVIPSGLGALTLSVVDGEVCAWDRFANRKQVGAYTGCCPGIHASGGQERHGPIDRCGNPRLRRQMVEAVWRFLRWQPGWHARQKYLPRLSDSVAQRKKVVVALARQLAIDLWRWRTGRCTLADLGLIGTTL